MTAPAIVEVMTDARRLDIGDTPPAFTLPNDSGSTTSLSDFAGERVVVYFYPKANTPGCTTEACDFRDSLTQLNDLGVKLVGISPDPVDKLAKFREDHDLNFPLLSDEDKTITTAYGVFKEKSMYGKTFMGIERSTFLIGADGKILRVWRKVKVPGHAEEVLEAVRDL